MAIFYEHIKGCGPQNKYLSWIKWSNEGEAPSTFDCKYLPAVKVGDKDFGTIITSNATNQHISKPFSFLEDITVVQSTVFLEYERDSRIEIDYGQGALDITGALSISCDATNYIKFTAPYFETNTIKAQSGDITTIKANTIKATGKCQADYFNATSDVRAKTNIIPTQFSALAVVNSIPTYTFNYINKPQECVLGLIAQEAAEYNLDGFNMVDNLTASGKDGDYMQMKESKLVYVLWKAVQELTDEVELLKAQLNNRK